MSNNFDKYDFQSIYGYIYKTTLPDGRVYIGQKKGWPMVETYYGSGKHLDNWFLKYLGYHSKNCPSHIAEHEGVQRECLDCALDAVELNLLERFYISLLMDTHDSSEYLNMHAGGNNKDIKYDKGYFTEEARLKGLEVRRQRAKEGLYVITDEVREKRSKGIKKALQRKPIWNKGLTKDTDDRVANLYKNRRKHVYTEEELHNISKITKDTFWWNNGIIQVRCKICPKGFERGMLKRKKH